MSTESPRQRFWEFVCGTIQFWATLFILSVVFAVMLLFSLLFISPGSGTFAVAVLDGVMLVIMLGGLGYVMRKCTTRDL